MDILYARYQAPDAHLPFGLQREARYLATFTLWTKYTTETTIRFKLWEYDETDQPEEYELSQSLLSQP
jgi:hypothetical protein